MLTSRQCAAIVLLFAMAASSLPATAQPKHGGVLRIAERTDPIGFDTLGQKKAAVYTPLALGYTHNRLFKYGPKGEVVLNLAASYSQPNPTTYVIVLTASSGARPPRAGGPAGAAPGRAG